MHHTALGALATDEAQASDQGEIAASGSDVGRPSDSDTDFKVVCIYNNIPPEPVKDPILTVKKEMFICKTPHIIGDAIDCIEPSGTTIPGPDSPDYWISWDDCNEILEPENVNDNFCQFFDEADFLMQIEQNPGPYRIPRK